MNAIEPVPGEPFRVHVQSESRPEITFLVDLQANALNGWCSCEDFQARCGERGTKTRCKHIRAARDWLLDQFLTELAETTGLVEEKIS
jgi:hypothetical protein